MSENLGHIEDDLIGTVLTETMASVPSEVTDVRRLLHTSESSRPALATAFAMGSLGTVVAVVGLGLVIIGGILLFFSTNGPGGQPVEPSVGAEVAPEVAAAPVEPAPAVEPDPESAPELLEVEAREAVDPQPRRTTAVRPPAPAPAPDVVMYELIITSFPMGAEVYIDDQKVGVTPLIDQPVPGGQRVLRLVSGDQEVSESITVDRRAPRRYVWRVDEGLESSF